MVEQFHTSGFSSGGTSTQLSPVLDDVAGEPDDPLPPGSPVELEEEPEVSASPELAATAPVLPSVPLISVAAAPQPTRHHVKTAIPLLKPTMKLT